MKLIVKDVEPEEFSNWKKRKKGTRSWKTVKTEIKQIVRKSLLKEQGFICCYCEGDISTDSYHVEHFLPKSKSERADEVNYLNLHASCLDKLNVGDPRHCGVNRGNRDIISPLDPECELRFAYDFSGAIKPLKSSDAEAINTIEALNLDIDKLNKLREKAIEPFVELLEDAEAQDMLRRFVRGYLRNKEDNHGKFNPYYSTVKYLFSNFLEDDHG